MDVVNPDHVGVIQSNTIATPDILGVDIGDSKVLENNVGGTDQAETFTLDGGTALADQGLVAANGDTEDTGIVIGNGHGGRIGLVVGAPVVLVDGNLAGRGGTPGGTAGRGGGALGTSEVVGTLDDNDTGRVVTKVGNKLVGRRGVDRSGAATTSDALGETFSGACWKKGYGLAR